MLKDAQGNEFTRVYGVVTFYARNRLEFSHQVLCFCFIGWTLLGWSPHVQVQLQHPKGWGRDENSKPEYIQTFFFWRKKMGPSITYISLFLPVVPKQMGLPL